MKPYKTLFEKYRKGILPESGIEELNHILVESYFLSPSELSKDELEYAEDLIIELYGIRYWRRRVQKAKQILFNF